MNMNSHTRTIGEIFIDRLSNKVELVNGFSDKPFSEADLLATITDIGASTERFLQLIIPLQEKESSYFSRACSEIRKFGYTDEANALDVLRSLYNDIKHDGAFIPTLEKTQKSLRNAYISIVKLVEKKLGETSTPVINNESIFWVSACDHYTSNETEIIITLPSDVEHWLGPAAIDHIIIKGTSWDDFKKELSTSGIIVKAEDAIPKWAIDALTMDADSLMPFAFIGHYSALLRAGTKYEYRAPGLLPFLSRSSSTIAMRVAFVIACLDAARENNKANGPQIAQLANQIAVKSLGVPDDYTAFEKEIKDFANKLAKLTPAARRQLKGPAWVDKGSFQQLGNVRGVLNKSLGVAVGPDLRIILEATSIKDEQIHIQKISLA